MSKLRISIICIFATWSLGAAGQQPPQPEDDGSLVLLHHLQQQEAGHEITQQFVFSGIDFKYIQISTWWQVAELRHCLFADVCCDGQKSEISLLCNAALSIRLKMMPSIQFS